MIIEISYQKTKNWIVDNYYHMIWWIKNEKYKRIPCLIKGHRWEFWNLLNAYKCKRCGDPQSWYKGDKNRKWGRGYYESGQFKKGDHEWAEAIRMRKTLGGGKVGYFKDGERVA